MNPQTAIGSIIVLIRNNFFKENSGIETTALKEEHKLRTAQSY